MASLYEINDRLVNIFNEIESNEGEVNDELYDALVITKEELDNKLDSYVKAIKSWSADADAIKTEKSKLNARQNVYKNRVERLKKAICVAVNNFGTNESDLVISKCFINPGPIYKRIQFASRGNVDRHDKRTSHIVVYVTDNKEETK